MRSPKIDSPPGGNAPTELVVKDIKEGNGAEAKAGDNGPGPVLGRAAQGRHAVRRLVGPRRAVLVPARRGQVIPGWDQGVAGMKEGGRRVLVIPSDLGYGPPGLAGAIGPGETLVFVVDLEKIKSP